MQKESQWWSRAVYLTHSALLMVAAIFSVFYLAVLVSAWRGGLGPALLTTAIGTVANILLLISPYYHVALSLQDGLRVLVFVIVSLAIAVIADRLEKSKRALQKSLLAEREARARARAVTDADALYMPVREARCRDHGLDDAVDGCA